MPVRIYDISKKLGLENKEILAQAKALGIAAAKVPSSSLDKITAEWLEEELVKTHPEVAARLAPKPPPEPPKPAPVEEKIVLITAPPPPPSPEPTPEAVVVETITATAPSPVVEAPKPAAPPPPPKPAVPKVGDKVGFIQLPTRPAARRKRRSGQTSAVTTGRATETRFAPAISALPRWPPGAAASARTGQTRRAGRPED
jgi:translation initiation factor IF-2